MKKEKYKKRKPRKRQRKKQKAYKMEEKWKIFKNRTEKRGNVLKPAELDMLTTLAPGLAIKHYKGRLQKKTR